MQTYGERRNETRQQVFLTRRAGFKQCESRDLAAARRRDKKIMHRRARRTVRIDADA